MIWWGCGAWRQRVGCGLPLSLFLLYWSSLGNMGLDHRVPMLGIFSCSHCQRFPLTPRLAWPEPDILSPCCPHLTLPLLTVLDVLWQSSAPLWPKFSSKRASISCYYQQLPKLYLSSLRAFIQLTPHKSQPLVLTLLAHVQLFPVSCRSAVLKSPRASPLGFSDLFHTSCTSALRLPNGTMRVHRCNSGTSHYESQWAEAFLLNSVHLFRAKWDACALRSSKK